MWRYPEYSGHAALAAGQTAQHAKPAQQQQSGGRNRHHYGSCDARNGNAEQVICTPGWRIGTEGQHLANGCHGGIEFVVLRIGQDGWKLALLLAAGRNDQTDKQWTIVAEGHQIARHTTRDRGKPLVAQAIGAKIDIHIIAGISIDAEPENCEGAAFNVECIAETRPEAQIAIGVPGNAVLHPVADVRERRCGCRILSEVDGFIVYAMMDAAEHRVEVGCSRRKNDTPKVQRCRPGRGNNTGHRDKKRRFSKVFYYFDPRLQLNTKDISRLTILGCRAQSIPYFVDNFCRNHTFGMFSPIFPISCGAFP